MLLNHEHLTVQDADVVSAAIEKFKKRPALASPTASYSRDRAKKRGTLPLGTFDRGPRKARWCRAIELVSAAGGCDSGEGAREVFLSELTRRNASEVIGLLTEKASYRGPERIGRRLDAVATDENHG